MDDDQRKCEEEVLTEDSNNRPGQCHTSQGTENHAAEACRTAADNSNTGTGESRQYPGGRVSITGKSPESIGRVCVAGDSPAGSRGGGKQGTTEECGRPTKEQNEAERTGKREKTEEEKGGGNNKIGKKVNEEGGRRRT